MGDERRSSAQRLKYLAWLPILESQKASQAEDGRAMTSENAN
jgi:hypothetical protein